MWFTEKHDKSYREDKMNANQAGCDHKLTKTIQAHHKEKQCSFASLWFYGIEAINKGKGKTLILSYYMLRFYANPSQ